MTISKYSKDSKLHRAFIMLKSGQKKRHRKKFCQSESVVIDTVEIPTSCILFALKRLLRCNAQALLSQACELNPNLRITCQESNLVLKQNFALGNQNVFRVPHDSRKEPPNPKAN